MRLNDISAQSTHDVKAMSARTGLEQWCTRDPPFHEAARKPGIAVSNGDSVSVKMRQVGGQRSDFISKRFPHLNKALHTRPKFASKDRLLHGCTSPGQGRQTDRSCSESTFV